jgi:hypothetical protein
VQLAVRLDAMVIPDGHQVRDLVLEAPVEEMVVELVERSQIKKFSSVNHEHARQFIAC